MWGKCSPPFTLSSFPPFCSFAFTPSPFIYGPPSPTADTMTYSLLYPCKAFKLEIIEYFPGSENYATDRGFICSSLAYSPPLQHSSENWSIFWFWARCLPPRRITTTFNFSICRWPVVKMVVTPESIVTYPEHSVDVILEFPTVQCTVNENSSQDIDLPEFWLELFYCGHDIFCSSATVISPHSNSTVPTTLYAELVRGFPRHRLVQLRCELFGLAGNYAVKLRAARNSSTFITQTAFIKVWQSD